MPRPPSVSRTMDLENTPRRWLAATLAGLSLLVELGMLIAGSAHVKVDPCSGHTKFFAPFIVLATAAVIAAGASVFLAFRSLQAPGRVSRSLVPLASIAALLVGLLVLYDILTNPGCLNLVR